MGSGTSKPSSKLRKKPTSCLDEAIVTEASTTSYTYQDLRGEREGNYASDTESCTNLFLGWVEKLMPRKEFPPLRCPQQGGYLSSMAGSTPFLEHFVELKQDSAYVRFRNGVSRVIGLALICCRSIVLGTPSWDNSTREDRGYLHTNFAGEGVSGTQRRDRLMPVREPVPTRRRSLQREEEASELQVQENNLSGRSLVEQLRRIRYGAVEGTSKVPDSLQ